MPVAGDPLTLKAMNGLVTLLGGISAGAEYNTDVGTVKLSAATAIEGDALNYPAILIRPSLDNFNDEGGRGGTQTVAWDLSVDILMLVDQLLDPIEALEKLKSDVVGALLSDDTLLGAVGSKVTHRVFPLRATPRIYDYNTRTIHGVELQIQLQLETLRSNLNELR